MAQRKEPELAIDQIQADVLLGFRTDAEVLLAFRISHGGAARDWLRSLAGTLTTATEVLAADQDRSRARGPWRNVGLSYTGLGRLTAAAYRFADEAFQAGQAARSALLGDPTDERDEGHPGNWKVGGPGNEPDVLVLLGGELDQSYRDGTRSRTDTATARQLEAEAEQVVDTAAEFGVELLWQETGMTLSRRPSTEHFGFRDGVSQPGVRGLVPGSGPRRYLTARELRNRMPQDWPELAAPGTPLIWPGSFVFGYPAQNPLDARAPGPEATAGPAWAANGSFLVLRRLRQRVDRFQEFLARVAGEHAKRGLPGATPEALAALLVGRWKSGAPIVRSQPDDDEALGSDRYAANHFDFTTTLPRLLVDGRQDPDEFPVAVADPLGRVCPNSAHIRKVNPRTGYTEQGGLEDTLTRRILRRGIPYGPAVHDLDNLTAAERQQDRGLLFISYQTSIVHQFEFLIREWSNSPSAPRGGGLDLLIGQRGDRPRTCFLVDPGGGSVEVTAHERWVIPTGGGYFFVPSVSGLQTLVGMA